jgi:hypothetical protein
VTPLALGIADDVEVVEVIEVSLEVTVLKLDESSDDELIEDSERLDELLDWVDELSSADEVSDVVMVEEAAADIELWRVNQVEVVKSNGDAKVSKLGRKILERLYFSRDCLF